MHCTGFSAIDLSAWLSVHMPWSSRLDTAAGRSPCRCLSSMHEIDGTCGSDDGQMINSRCCPYCTVESNENWKVFISWEINKLYDYETYNLTTQDRQSVFDSTVRLPILFLSLSIFVANSDSTTFESFYNFNKWKRLCIYLNFNSYFIYLKFKILSIIWYAKSRWICCDYTCNRTTWHFQLCL